MSLSNKAVRFQVAVWLFPVPEQDVHDAENLTCAGGGGSGSEEAHAGQLE